MTFQRSSFVSAADAINISTYGWTSVEGDPKGVVQIAHGLAEHAARYDRLATHLNAAGYLVFATDHRGHGESAQGRLGDFGEAGFTGLISDVVQYGAALAAEYPGLPLFLIGHSMGSFASQSAMITDSEQYAGVVLSGSTALDVLAAGLAESDGPVGLEAFNVGFENRTGYEWLSRDEAEVDAYVADPLCGFDLDDETVPMLFGSAAELADPEVLANVRSDLPILVASGSDDPLAGGGQLVEILGQRYRDAGVSDVVVAVYPEARHEIFNEVNRGEIMDDIVGWLDRQLENLTA